MRDDPRFEPFRQPVQIDPPRRFLRVNEEGDGWSCNEVSQGVGEHQSRVSESGPLARDTTVVNGAEVLVEVIGVSSSAGAEVA